MILNIFRSENHTVGAHLAVHYSTVKEIEKIETVINDIDKFSIIDIDQNLFKSFEMIRENYNKILLNIQKVTYVITIDDSQLHKSNAEQGDV